MNKKLVNQSWKALIFIPEKGERSPYMKDTMILKNGTIIELEAGTSLGALQVAAANRAAMVTTWEALTPDNLTAVQIKNCLLYTSPSPRD